MGHPGAQLEICEEPDQGVPHVPTQCARCGTPLVPTDDLLAADDIDRRQVFDLNMVLKMTEHRTLAVVCEECGEETVGAFPSTVPAPVQYGPGVHTPCSVEPQAPRRTPVKSWKVSLRGDPAARHAAQSVFGVTCFEIHATTAQRSTEAVIAWYRRQNRVEEAFHEIQSPLTLRPLFLGRSHRIRAHGLACVLAYGIDNAMEERLRLESLAESPATGLDALASRSLPIYFLLSSLFHKIYGYELFVIRICGVDPGGNSN